MPARRKAANAPRSVTAAHTTPSRPQPQLRARLWVEIAGGPALSEAGADLLEQIDACHSLSQAARTLRFSYRRAWMLIDAMNKRWPQPLVETFTGGKRGGGSFLTDHGLAVLRSYRSLQVEAEAFLDRATDHFRAGLD